ncbi:MAG: hypothetical protein ABIJ82_00825 [Patescibacteria group bacterium]|nr:hypothetical protein [Patescibacteria group bacterium]MBU1952881.1 hypothetical protein [Patescibacteria group bacterium]
MKKKLLILLILLALIFASILLIGFVKKFTTTTSNTPKTTTGKEEAVITNPTNTANTDQGQKCIFSATDENGTFSGTSYVSGDKSNTVTNNHNPDGVLMEFNNISDGEWIYSWATGEDVGTKIKVTDLPIRPNTTDPEATSTETTPATECTPWTADNSMFVIPSNIQFQESPKN